MKCLLDWTTLIANVASIVTAIVATFTSWWLWRRFRSKKKMLEDFLRDELENAKKVGKQGAHGVPFITKEIGLSESEILQASFKNPRIKKLVPHGDGISKEVLFQYNENSPN